MKNTIKKISAIVMAFTIFGSGTAITKIIAPQFDSVITASAANEVMYVAGNDVNVRVEPNKTSSAIVTTNCGDKITISQKKNGWGKVVEYNGWISLDLTFKYPTAIKQSDFIWICNSVSCEAGDDRLSRKEKACIVEVIMNRTKSRGKSISDVIRASDGLAHPKDNSKFHVASANVVKAVEYYFNNLSEFNQGYEYFCAYKLNGVSRNYFSKVHPTDGEVLVYNCPDVDTHCFTSENRIQKPSSKTPVTKIFNDVYPDTSYVNAIQFVYDKKIMVGKGKSFGYKDILKREEFIQVLYNLEGKPDIKGGTTSFKDVEKGKWYYNAIVWAKNNHVAEGYLVEEGSRNQRFGVGDDLTRQQAVQMLYSYACNYAAGRFNTDKKEGKSNDFKKDAFAKNAMDWAVTRGIISTSSWSDRYPKDATLRASRAECADMIMNFLKKAKK